MCIKRRHLIFFDTMDIFLDENFWLCSFSEELYRTAERIQSISFWDNHAVITVERDWLKLTSVSTSSDCLKPRPRTIPQVYLLQMHFLLPRKTDHITHNHILSAFHILQGQQILLQDLRQNHTRQLEKKKNKLRCWKRLFPFIYW